MISVQIALKLKKLVQHEFEGMIDKKRIYLYDIPENEKRIELLPAIRINHITSTATTHSSNEIDFTRERFQIQYFYDDEFDGNIEDKIIQVERVLRENGFYYSTGYDSFDPELDGVITVTRQYNYRNNLINTNN